MLKEIFKNIEGREWDNQNDKWILHKVNIDRVYFEKVIEGQYIDSKGLSLADLLSNKSWCRVVWGWGGNMFNLTPAWEWNSWQAFEILQRKGKEEALKYILNTMI